MYSYYSFLNTKNRNEWLTVTAPSLLHMTVRPVLERILVQIVFSSIRIPDSYTGSFVLKGNDSNEYHTTSLQEENKQCFSFLESYIMLLTMTLFSLIENILPLMLTTILLIFGPLLVWVLFTSTENCFKMQSDTRLYSHKPGY